ncbi:MAG: glycosyltransferase family 2 protein [Candidatus Peribacteraceae bacterium]|nr:glycosyltransferase family 2 protein [Candidatus Peribacteraceae bacterium]MDD5075189.1 glycosyltransferase family 2 protein [Candidatus Peribacteraceae bacterium]
MISVLIPVFNEEEALPETLRQTRRVLESVEQDFEIVVINDGSMDGTAKILDSIAREGDSRIVIIHHTHNWGYSASLKNGIRQSKGDIIGIIDADGTYPIDDFPTLIRTLQEKRADMVVGARTKKGAKIPLMRRPAKAIINLLAQHLTGLKIPDLNSGFRVFTRVLGERFMPLYPQRFSFTITITLAALTNDYIVEYVPINYFKRTGKSSLSTGMNGIWNFLNFLSLVTRIVTYFRPLRFFLWPAIFIGGSGLLLILYTISTQGNLSDSGLLLFLTGLQIGLFGMMGEAIVRNRSTL